MPEAVIVSIARSPIGGAVKGSLKEMRPDDLAAQMVTAALDKIPALDRSIIDDLLLGCGEPGGRGRIQPRAGRRDSLGSGDRSGDDGQPILLLEPADDPGGFSRYQIGRRGMSSSPQAWIP